MATFAIFYNFQDMSAMAGSVTNPGLSGADRNEVNRYWNAGLKDWSTAPLGVSPYDYPPTGDDPSNSDCRRIVVSGGNNVTRDGLIALLRRLAATYGQGFEWLRGLANDMEGPVPGQNCSGSWAPWPPS